MRNSIHSPVSRLQKPIFSPEDLKFLHRSVRAIPTRIHPEVFKSNIFFGYLINQTQAGRCLHSAPNSKRDGKNDGASVILRSVIFEDMAPQNIMRIDIISLPREQQNFRSSNLLTGMEREMCPSHTGRYSDRRFGWTGEIHGPRSRPSQGPDQATPARLNIEERYGLTRLTTTLV